MSVRFNLAIMSHDWAIMTILKKKIFFPRKKYISLARSPVTWSPNHFCLWSQKMADGTTSDPVKNPANMASSDDNEQPDQHDLVGDILRKGMSHVLPEKRQFYVVKAGSLPVSAGHVPPFCLPEKRRVAFAWETAGAWIRQFYVFNVWWLCYFCGNFGFNHKCCH